MPFYFHPDIKTFNFQSHFLKSGVINIYTYLSDNKEKLPLKEDFAYFPLTYFFLGFYQIIASPILGSEFQTWLTDASVSSVERIGVFRYLFILKLPYLILDLLIAFLLAGLFKDAQTRKKVFTFWLFNPFSFVTVYLFSNVDIFPVFLIVLSLYLASKKRIFLSAIALGLGAGFKAFPLLLAPFLYLEAKTKKQKIFTILGSAVLFALIIGPFITSSSFRQSTLTSGLTTRIISYGVDIGFGELLLPSVVLLSLLFLWRMLNVNIELWKNYLISFLLVLTLIHFHIHWLLWVIPFMAILYAVGNKNDQILVLSFLILSFAIPLLYSDKFMSVGLISVIDPLYASLPTPASAVSRIYKPEVLQSVLHSIIVALGIILSWRSLTKKI